MIDCFDNPDLTLEELMHRWPQVIDVFLRNQMLCVGCQIRPFHTLADACKEYQLEPKAFRAELAEAVKTKREGLGPALPIDVADAP
ncbi:DUF1858 domain-containing protein [Parasedimentitalea maritima]|nr:DUF1858 domain-containing protein [Zongyanglinia marina]